jgi:plasmid maintenance system antidote protein VapI
MPIELKIGILRSGRTQREISLSARIPETRLSHIVRDRVAATNDERARLARALDTAAEQLFPATTPQEAA